MSDVRDFGSKKESRGEEEPGKKSMEAAVLLPKSDNQPSLPSIMLLRFHLCIPAKIAASLSLSLSLSTNLTVGRAPYISHLPHCSDGRRTDGPRTGERRKNKNLSVLRPQLVPHILPKAAVASRARAVP